MKKEVCKGKVYGKSYPYPDHPCRNKAWKDGYCQLHHPDERGRRRKKNQIEKEKLYQEAQERKKIISSNLLPVSGQLPSYVDLEKKIVELEATIYGYENGTP